MTFCLGMIVDEGIVGIADTRLTSGNEIISAKKRGDLQKTKLKVMDMGPEANGGDLYWIDFLGEASLSDSRLRELEAERRELMKNRRDRDER